MLKLSLQEKNQKPLTIKFTHHENENTCLRPVCFFIRK